MSEPKIKDIEKEALDRERYEALEQLEDWLERPVQVLGFIWLLLLFAELIFGERTLLTFAVYAIWIIFLLDFGLRFFLAPQKSSFIRKNWLTVLSLVLPALRIFAVFRALRFLRLARATRSLRLVKVVGSVNRGMRALRSSMSRRGFGYILLLTIVVTLVGSAGMYAFEGPPSVQQEGGDVRSAGYNQFFETYGDALWWTSMIMATLGSGGWPETAEGRLLGFLLALYAFAVFGYVTATLATYFIGREAESPESEVVGMEAVEALRAEISALKQEIHSLRNQESND